jgi:hypothetical protein
MKRLALLYPLVVSVGCPGGETLPDASDAGGELPDAVVIGPRDSGPSDVERPIPTLNGVSPAAGPETGGTRVTLRGSNFAEPAAVFFGDLPATSVVVLDEVSIAATTPPHGVGSVLVKVVTEGGEAELPDGFFFHREVRLDAVEPARIPDEGGVEIAILGKGFDENTIVFMDRQPVRGLTLVSDERMTGYAPPLEPGRPDVRVMNRDAEARRGDVVVVFGTPDILGVLPGYGPISGRVAQEIAGDGLSDAEQVTIGGVAVESLTIQSDGLLSAESPPLSEGVYDVTVSNSDASGTLAGGYIAYNPLMPGIAVLGVLPRRIPEGSGATITVVGRGFGPSPQLAVDGVRLPVLETSANAVTAMMPQALALGPHDVTIINGAQQSTFAGGLEVYAPMQVTAISPTTGPAAGGTAVTITGRGFSAGAEVRIAGVPLSGLVVEDDTTITGVTVAGTHGTHDVVVKSAGEVAILENAFTFTEQFSIIRLDPNEGSVAGNTYVSVFGRGFTAPAAVEFGGVEAASVRLENGSIIGARTEPARSGPVDVLVRAGPEEQNLPQAFTFYDPRLLTGGAWGGEIDGSVNVAVQTFNGQPLAGMVVQLGFDADLRYTAVTDENGHATISSPEIRGAQTVTVGAPQVEFVTFYEVNAKNLTMFADPYPMSMPPDAPLAPCPMPAQAPIVTGRIFKFKSSLDPVTMPGWVPVARITYTQPSVFQQNPPDPPEQFDFVFEDGGEYTIVVLRVGTVAVYAELGDFNPETQEFIPRKMGIARNVPVAIATITADIDISLDIDLDQTTRIRLDDPPEQQPGPSINAVFPFLNLASEGVIAFPATAVFGGGDVILENLPNLPESQFFYMGGSFTQGNNGGLQTPYSLTLLETSAPFAEGVDLGPFLQMPQNVSPKPGALLESGVISWDQPGIRPDITTINVVDVVGVSACCCLDNNMNGQCEDAEPPQCGGLPQQFNRWSLFAEGGLASYVLPQMPSGVEAFASPTIYPWLVQMAIAPRFDFREFIYNQFSPFFWQSWAAWFSQFTVKEETD